MVPAAVSDAFVAKYDAAGGLLFAHTLLADSTASGAEVARALSVVAHDDGTTYVFMDHDSAVDVGTGPIDPLNDTVGQQSMLLRLSEVGELLWSAQIGGDGLVYARSLAVDEQGRAAVSGTFLNSIDLGGQTFGNVFPYDEQERDIDGTNYDAYVAVFESDGSYLWGEHLGWMRDEGAEIVRLNNNALVYRQSDDRISFAAYSPDGNGELLGGEFDGARAFRRMSANDEAVVLGARIGDDHSWAFDASPYAVGNGDAMIVYLGL